MKLKFRAMSVYMKHLNREISQRQIEDVRKTGKLFLMKYSDEIDRIIRLLPETTGKSWPKEDGNEIEVYFVEWKGSSFSHPLTLKVRKDLLLMLVILTHELGHHLIPMKAEESHEEINRAVEKVFKKLNIDAKEQIAVMRGYQKK